MPKVTFYLSALALHFHNYVTNTALSVHVITGIASFIHTDKYLFSSACLKIISNTYAPKYWYTCTLFFRLKLICGIFFNAFCRIKVEKHIVESDLSLLQMQVRQFCIHVAFFFFFHFLCYTVNESPTLHCSPASLFFVNQMLWLLTKFSWLQRKD